MNLPNRLSLLRIALVPVMAVCFYINFDYGALLAVAVFLIAAFTDFLDGYIARKTNQITELGKLLDPRCRQAFGGGGAFYGNRRSRA